MNNKYLERELKHNLSTNEIFECQTCHDLDNIRTFLKENKLLTEVIVEFDSEKIKNSRLLRTFQYESYENDLIWEQFVAIQLMKELRKELNMKVNSDLDEQEQIIYNASKESYMAYEKCMPTSNDVKELISMVNTPIRLHFLLRWCNDKCLCDSLMKYLIKGLCFSTMIYSDRYFNSTQFEKQEVGIEYYYIKFNKLEEGSYINNSKQKVKKYEEV